DPTRDVEPARELLHHLPGLPETGGPRRGPDVSVPQGKAVGPPDQLQRPAGKALARIGLALTGDQRRPGHHPPAQLGAEAEALRPLGGTERLVVPLRRVGVLAGIEGRLAAAGERE